MPYQALLPKHDQMRIRRKSYLYAGLGLWESRGISLPRAIAAMLGDTSIFYETPLFTLYKTQILGKNVADFVYDSNKLCCQQWSGYNHFMTEVVPFTNAIEMLQNLGYKRGHIDVARKNVSLASELAKILLDFDFYQRMRCKNKYTCNNVLPNLRDTFGETQNLTHCGTQNDILWTSSYLPDALQVGPNIMVLDPEVYNRSLCLEDFIQSKKAWNRCNENKNDLQARTTTITPTTAATTSCREVMTPGYIHGSLIRGFELRFDPNGKGYNANRGLYKVNPPLIRLAFYRRNSITDEEKSYVIVVVPPPNNSTYCIVYNENLPLTRKKPWYLTSNITSPPLTACDFNGTLGLNPKVSNYSVNNIINNYYIPCKSKCNSTITNRPLMGENDASLPIAGKNMEYTYGCVKYLYKTL